MNRTLANSVVFVLLLATVCSVIVAAERGSTLPPPPQAVDAETLGKAVASGLTALHKRGVVIHSDMLIELDADVLCKAGVTERGCYVVKVTQKPLPRMGGDLRVAEVRLEKANFAAMEITVY